MLLRGKSAWGSKLPSVPSRRITTETEGYRSGETELCDAFGGSASNSLKRGMPRLQCSIPSGELVFFFDFIFFEILTLLSLLNQTFLTCLCSPFFSCS